MRLLMGPTLPDRILALIPVISRMALIILARSVLSSDLFFEAGAADCRWIGFFVGKVANAKPACAVTSIEVSISRRAKRATMLEACQSATLVRRIVASLIYWAGISR